MKFRSRQIFSNKYWCVSLPLNDISLPGVAGILRLGSLPPALPRKLHAIVWVRTAVRKIMTLNFKTQDGPARMRNVELQVPARVFVGETKLHRIEMEKGCRNGAETVQFSCASCLVYIRITATTCVRIGKN